MRETDIFDYQQQLLLKETETIQANIRAYDDLSFKIKGWAVTLWSVIVVWGVKEQKPEVVVISFFIILAFWLLDMDFKRYQGRLMVRMDAIEDFVNGEKEYQKKGLKEAFEQRSFGDFPVHDPISRLHKRQSENISHRNDVLIYSALCIATLIMVFNVAF